MKIAHASDLHIGYRSGKRLHENGVNLREQDGYDALEEMVTDIINHEVDVMVIAGDIFHSPFPSPRNIMFVQGQFRRLAEAGIRVEALTGNHDTNDVAADISASKILDDPMRGLHSYAEPYIHQEIFDGVHLHLISHHMYNLQAETMKQIKAVEGEVNILTTHGSVIDPLMQMKLTTKDSPREIVIPDFLLSENDWSYIMLGHIHERGWVGSMGRTKDLQNTKTYYNGSLIRRGFSDAETPLGRGWTLWTIDTDGNFSYEIKQVKQRPQQDLAVIDALNMTPKEITDAIISNLQSTQEDGVKFNPKSAPILRQRVINATPAKRAALDMKAINAEKGHAFNDFAPEIGNLIQEKNIDKNDNGKKIDHLSSIRGSDILSGYDLWKENSVQLSQVNEQIRDEVAERSREFVKQGQEKVFSDE